MVILSSQSHLLRRQLSSHTRLVTLLNSKPFSSQSQPPPDPQTPKPTSLSARMSFVFDQIDSIERDRQEKDQTLQRIRAWRQSKSINNHPAADAELTNTDSPVVKNNVVENDEKSGLLSKKQVELAHPWPEWLELMERLVQQNYFDHKRKDEDGMIEDMGFNVSEAAEEQGFDFTRDAKTVQEALLNFGRDRFDILRSLSRQDLQILVGYGCPTTDKRVTFSAKVLRKHVHLDEGDVCSSCNLRNSCERAYLLTNKEDEARAIDVMRVLLTYGFDPINGSVANKSLLKMKSVKTIVRKLLHEVVKLSAVPIDPNLPPPVFKKPPPKVKQPPPPPKKRVGRDDIEMKKGDWLCPKCDFMNFAKNTVCLQCDAKRPKRQLLPGEWECPQCNFLNYRRNVVCFHCESNRPPDEYTDNKMQERQNGPSMSFVKGSTRPEVSNAWNFDFDDDESDGADVASFEYADSSKINEDYPLAKQAHGGDNRGYRDGSGKSTDTKMYERDYSGPIKPGTGFNDFDDEDDDVDNYEVETHNEGQRASRIDFSDLEGNSDSDDNGDVDLPRRQTRGGHRKEEQIDFGSDDERPIHSNWKPSHVDKFKHRGVSDDEIGLSSGSDESGDEGFRSKPNRGNRMSSNSRGLVRRGGGARSSRYSDSESDDDRGFQRGKQAGFRGRGNGSMGRSSRGGGRNSFKNDFDGSRGNNRGSGGYTNDRQNSRGRDDGDSRNFGGSRGQGRGSFNQQRGNNRGSGGYTNDRQNSRGRDDGDSRNFGGSRGRGRGSFNQQRGGRSNSYDNKSSNAYFDDERFQKPRINVR